MQPREGKVPATLVLGSRSKAAHGRKRELAGWHPVNVPLPLLQMDVLQPGFVCSTSRSSFSTAQGLCKGLHSAGLSPGVI